jgi:hypothetical protein
MVRKPVSAICILAVCLVTVSCKKLETANPAPTGPLTFEPSRFVNAIPDEYGNLIGVTQNPSSPRWVGLWFQRSDRTITAVFVNLDEGKLYEKALTIPRK